MITLGNIDIAEQSLIFPNEKQKVTGISRFEFGVPTSPQPGQRWYNTIAFPQISFTVQCTCISSYDRFRSAGCFNRNLQILAQERLRVRDFLIGQH